MAVSTNFGSQRLWSLAQSIAGNQIGLGDLNGALSSPFTVSHIHVENDALSLKIDQIEVDWDLSTLIHRSLDVQDIKVDGVNLHSKANDTNSTATKFDFGDLRIPVALEVAHASLSRFRFQSETSTPVLINNLDFDFALNTQEIKVGALDLAGPIADLNAKLRVDLNTTKAEGALRWNLRLPEFPTATGNAEIAGTLDQLVMDWQLRQPYLSTGKATAHSILSKPRVTAVINDIDLSLSAIRKTLPDTKVRGFIKLQANITEGHTAFQSALALKSLPQIGSVKTAIDGVVDKQRVSIRQWRISPDHSDAQIDANGQILFTNEKELELEIDWQNLQWPMQTDPVLISGVGRSKITGTLSKLDIQVESTIDQPLVSAQTRAEVKLDLTSAQPIVSAQATIPELRFPHSGETMLEQTTVQLNIEGQMPRLNADIHISKPGYSAPSSITANGEVNLASANQPTIELNGHWENLHWPLEIATAEESQVNSNRGDFNISGTPESISASVTAGINERGSVHSDITYTSENINIKTDWHNLAFSRDNQILESTNGELSIEGTLDDYTFAIETAASLEEKHVELLAAGTGNQTSLTLAQIDAGILGGKVNGEALLDWSSGISTTVNLNGMNLNPGVWWQPWSGNMNGQIVSQARIHDSILEIGHAHLQVNGELREFPVEANLVASQSGATINVDTLSIKSAETLFNASGVYADDLSIQWDINSRDLNTVHPLAGGKLNATGSLSGTPQFPVINGEIKGEGVRYDQHFLRYINGKVAIDSTDSSTSNVSLNLAGEIAGVEVLDTEVYAEGFSKDYRVSITSNTESGALEAKLHHRLQSPSNWEMEINSAQLQSMDYGRWMLDKSATASYDGSFLSLSSTCFKNEASVICVSGNQQDGVIDSAFNFSNIYLQQISSALAKDIVLEGTISGSGKLRKEANSDPTGTFQINNTAGRIAAPTDESEEKDTQLLVFDAGEMALQFNPGKIQASVSLPLAGSDTVNATAELTGLGESWVDRQLIAEVNTNISNIEFLQQLIPGTRNLAGSIQGSMNVSGSIENPTFFGSLKLQDGVVEIAAAETLFDNIEIEVEGNPETGMDISGRANSGGGNLSLTGKIDLSQGTPTADVVLTGQKARVFNSAIAEVYVSPDLRLKVDNKRVDLTGEITVPKANITIQSVPRSAIKPTDDQIIVVEKNSGSVIQNTFQLTANVKTRLGEDVNFSGFGLTGRLAGELTSIETPGKPGEISGEIKINDGKYQAYGQNLTIETGRLLYAGTGATNPSVDLRASRQPTNEVKVGVSARGKLQQPEFSLYSTPSMTDRNKLSYLLLGRAADQTSDGEKSQLGQLALALGLKRSSGITNLLGETLGIDTIGVEAEPGTNAEQESFVIGKYLTPNLYLRYGIGLFEPINTLRLQYSINEHWKIVTESSDKASSGDIQYSIDR
ncbi:MAG: translocation/assembly module TamB domain-containing protein [Acidiferrobacterales bacterium]|nr:translocation/assembly module TamB domain-containing protein [Acidiferrobacterales bacterium]